jgi:PPOX class probable F420-dependent enzyme
MPPLTKEELDDFLDKAPVATLCTHNEDGTIHAAPIWFKYEGGKLLFGTQADCRRVKNLKRNKDVTVVVESHEAPAIKGAVIYGRAELDRDDVVAKRVGIFRKYMPEENARGLESGLSKFRPPEKQVVIRVTPTKIVSYDYGKDETGLFK